MDDQERLAAAARVLNDSVRRVDHDSTALAGARELIEQATAMLDADLTNGPFMQAGLAYEVEGPPSFGQNDATGAAVFPYSPAIGPRNPISPQVDIWFDGDRTLGSARVGAAHNGPPDMVHGGIIALIFDELLGTCAVRSGLGGFTGTLSVRYQAPTPLHEPLDLSAHLDRVEGRKVFVVGEIRHGDVCCASAEGIFIRAAHLSGE